MRTRMAWGMVWAIILLWPACGWGEGYQMQISFSNYTRAETLTNFPLLVSLQPDVGGSRFDYSGFISPNGYDLRFRDSAGVRLNYEIECWNTGAMVMAATDIPGCALWLRGDLGVQANGSGQVTAWLDQSGQGHDAGNVVGTPTLDGAAGPGGKSAVTFDGSSYLYTSYNFDSLTNYTIFLVARYTGPDTSYRVLASMDRNWLFGFHGGHDEAFYAEGWIQQSGNNNTNWHVDAGTMAFAADPVAAFWKDGGGLTQNNPGSGPANYMLGRLCLGGQLNGQELSKCQISEVIVYSNVLSTADMNRVGAYLSKKYKMSTSYSASSVWVQVPALNSNSCIWASWGNMYDCAQLACTTNGSVWNAGFAGVWHLADGRDATSNGNNAVNSGAGPIEGRAGSAMYFSGAGMDVADSASLGLSSAVSFEGWIRPAAVDAWRLIWGDWKGTGSLSTHFALNASKPSLYISSTGSNADNLDGATSLVAGQWYYITATFDSGVFSIYLNGQSDAAQKVSGAVTSVYHSPDTKSIGIKNNGTLPFAGIIDELRVSSVARSSNWVWACYLNQGSNDVFNSYGRPDWVSSGTVMIIR